MIAIQCSRLFDGETFSAGAATVLIEENRIVAVESGFPALGEQWDVVHYHDATVLPGLIDTHVHLVGDSRPAALDRVPEMSADEIDRVISESLGRQLAAGVTTVRDLVIADTSSWTGATGKIPVTAPRPNRPSWPRGRR